MGCACKAKFCSLAQCFLKVTAHVNQRFASYCSSQIFRPSAKLPTERMYKTVRFKTGWLARVLLRAAAGSVDQALVPALSRLALVVAWSQPCMQGNASLGSEVS